MVKMSLFGKLNALRRNFAKADRGSVMITFALALVPMVALIGASVDYSRASAIRTAMQAAVDSTALAISSAAATQTDTQLQNSAQTFFNALFTRTDISNIAVTTVYTTTGGSQLQITSTGQMPTSFMGIMGFKTIKITASSTSTWGNTRLRVALVLDNTGSMSSAGKLTALKTATKNLLAQLKTAAVKDGDVYVSIIPFSKDISVDPVTNYTQSWIDWTDWNVDNGSCSKNNQNTKSGCLNKNGTWTPNDHSTWNGCITDRGNSNAPSSDNYDTNVAPTVNGVAASQFPAEQFASCTQPVMGLNYNWTTMNTLVDGMVAVGNTNQGIGLAWGWLSLDGGGPFTVPAMDKNYTYSKVIILLTDGLNTENRWYTSQNSIDNREKTTCANIKAAGITLYTVQVNTGNDPTSTLLKNCASGTENFHILTSANDIITTFAQIGETLSKLRIAR